MFDRYDGDLLDYMNDRMRVATTFEDAALSDADARVVMQHVLTALAGLHKKRVAHRDMYLKNILYRVNDSGEVEHVLGDFGLAVQACSVSEMARDMRMAGGVATVLLTACDNEADPATCDLVLSRRSRAARAFVARLMNAVAVPVTAADMLSDPFLLAR